MRRLFKSLAAVMLTAAWRGGDGTTPPITGTIGVIADGNSFKTAARLQNITP